MIVSPACAETVSPFSLKSIVSACATGSFIAFICWYPFGPDVRAIMRLKSRAGKCLHPRTGSGFGAACPSPQIEASAIACDSSSRSAASHFGASMSLAAFAVPARQGVHWPQDSSSKKRIMLSAASRALSWSESTITAAEPMKQPCGCSVSKSSGMSPIDAGRMPPEAPPGRYA